MLTEALDLRGGHPCWQDDDGQLPAADPLPERAEIAIIGAGVMGAMLAERLASKGHEVVVIDRRPPARGATAASTALVLWAADVPLSHLAARIGEEDTAYAWRRIHRAVQGLSERVADDADVVRWRSRPEVYLAGGLLDENALWTEGQLRERCGLPSRFLAGEAVAERFDLPPRTALVSDDTFGVDPVALTLTFLKRAQAAGARLCYPHDVERLDEDGDGIGLRIAHGPTLRCGQLILATGYESARWYLPPAFKLASSFAIATAPGTAPKWREKAMIWEAANPYLYGRGTVDGRIIIGGEDIDASDPQRRDALIPAKRGTLEAKGAALLGLDSLTADCAWAASFGTSPDGLPAIGKARNAERIWLAYGYGGNGISFASLGAELIAAELDGDPDPDARLFDPYR